MGVDIITSHIVGVSFVSVLDEARKKPDGEPDALEKLENAAEKLKLGFATEVHEFDGPTNDFFIGVEFVNRPTDKQLKKAKEKVKALLPKLEELVGRKADSRPQYWNVTTVC